MAVEFFPKGIKYLNAAVEADSAKKYQEALSLYIKSFEYLLAGIKYSKNERVNAIVHQKLKEYMTRAEEIKKELAVAVSQSSTQTKQKAEHPELSAEREKLRKTLEDAVMKEKPTISLNDVAGLDPAKEALKEAVVLPQKFPQLFTGKRQPWKGILLYGPPGTGKTLLAKAVAGMTNSTFFSISASNLISKWLGESEKLIRELFKMAMESKPSIIFIDEIDSICGNRSSDTNDATLRIKTEFMIQMNKIIDGEGVLVIGATNRPFDLDPAVRRRHHHNLLFVSRKFEKRIYIPLPDEDARKEILKIHLGSEPVLVDNDYFERLAATTEGYSGSDLSVIVRDVLMAPVREALRATTWKQIPNPTDQGPSMVWTPCSESDPEGVKKSLMEFSGNEIVLPPIQQRHFESALKTNKPSVSAKDLALQEKFTQMFGMPFQDKTKSTQHSTPVDTSVPLPSAELKLDEIEKDKKLLAELEQKERAELEFMKSCNELTDKVLQQKKLKKEEKKRSQNNNRHSATPA